MEINQANSEITKKQVEKAIRETLVVENKQSIPLAAERITAIQVQSDLYRWNQEQKDLWHSVWWEKTSELGKFTELMMSKYEIHLKRGEEAV